MALLHVSPIKAARVLGGFDIPHASDLEEAATQTYKIGAVLIFSSGTLTQASTHPTSGIVGISENAGQNLAAAGFYTKIEASNQGPLYIPAVPGVIYEGHLCNTSASDPQDGHNLAITDIGTNFALALGTTDNYWYVDFSDTTNVSVVVVGLKDATGGTGRVYFMFLNSKTIYN